MSAPPEELSAKEAEMLKYLEDLQRDNPAEYEYLVNQMNSKPGGAGKASDGPEGSIKVTPVAGFVAKTRSATQQGQKVFINVCQSEHVDPPEALQTNGESSDELPLRIPMSLGPPREDLDREGALCTVYDVVLNPETVASALAEKEFRTLMLQLTLHQIKQKYEDDLSHDISFPKVKGDYKGLAPLPQYMRKRKTPDDDEEDAAPSAPAAAPQKTSLVEELGSCDEAQLAHTLPVPAYAVEPRRASTQGTDEACGAADSLSIKVHLPRVNSASDVELTLSAEEMTLHVPHIYHLCVQLPNRVELTPLFVRFETQRHILSVVLRVEAAESAASLGTSGEGGEEQGRRGREAMQRAKRRVAAVKDRKAPEAAAPSADAGLSDVQVAADEATEPIAAEAAPAVNEVSLSDPAAGVEPPAPQKASPEVLRLSSSLMYEIEEF